MRHVAKNRQRKLFERPLGLHNLLKKRYYAIQSSILLAGLVQTTHVVDSVENLVADFPEVRPFDRRPQQVRKHVDGVGVLKRVESC